MDLFNKCYVLNRADEIKQMGLYPFFHALESKQDVVVMMNGKRKIMLGSNNYLGLTNDQRVIDASVEATREFGTGVSGSRFLNGTMTKHLHLEEKLAQFMNKESCLTFSTGFQANLGIISSIASRNDLILCDRENHASIYDGIRLSYSKMVRYKHNDMNELESLLKKAGLEKGKLIVTDGIFSMSGDICNLPEIVRLADKYKARILLDDAHGIGVIGKGGRGTASYFGLDDEVDMIMGTFSKSFGSLGGFFVSEKRVTDYIKHHSRPFIFSAAMPPSNVAAAEKALDIIQREPERIDRLLEMSDYMRNLFIGKGLNIIQSSRTPVVPIYTYTPVRTLIACKIIYENGVYVNPVLPPAANQNGCLIRTICTAKHTKSLIAEATDIISDALESLPETEAEAMKTLI